VPFEGLRLSHSRAFALSPYKDTNILVQAQIFVSLQSGTSHCLRVHYTTVFPFSKQCLRIYNIIRSFSCISYTFLV
jgi:hypothetical protein